MTARPLNLTNTLSDVLAWTDRMANTGIYKGSSARFKKNALEALASVVDADEPATADWMLEHVDELGNRWANKNGGNPSTVRTYISRARTVLKDYLRYAEDPKSFKVRGREKPEGTSRSKSESKAKSKNAKTRAPSHDDQRESTAQPGSERWRTFPLGKGRQEFTYRLPSDSFTVNDVLKVAYHLVTLAEDFDPSSSAQAQMFGLVRRGERGD